MRRSARQGAGPRQGHAQLHRQPDRDLRAHADARRGGEAGLHRRGGRRRVRPGHRSAEERRLSHRRRGRARHAGARHAQLRRRAAQRRAPRGVRPAARPDHAGREEVARRQDQAGLLQEGRQRHPPARSQDAGVRTAEKAALRFDRRRPRHRRRRREAAPHGGRHRSRLRPRPHRPLRDAHLRGQPPGGDRRQRGRHRSRAPLGVRLGARAVRDLGRPRRQGDLGQDGGGRLHRPRLGQRADLRPGRRDEVLSPGGARQARAARHARRLHPGRREPAPPLARRHPRRRRRGRAQRQRLAPRSRRRRLLPRVPRQDERHRRRHRRHDDEGGRQGGARRRRAGDRQRRPRRLLRRRQPVRADDRARPGEHAGGRRDGGRLPERLRAHQVRARPGGGRALRPDAWAAAPRS